VNAKEKAALKRARFRVLQQRLDDSKQAYVDELISRTEWVKVNREIVADAKRWGLGVTLPPFALEDAGLPPLEEASK
jgi:hypothetical protein